MAAVSAMMPPPGVCAVFLIRILALNSFVDAPFCATSNYMIFRINHDYLEFEIKLAIKTFELSGSSRKTVYGKGFST